MIHPDVAFAAQDAADDRAEYLARFPEDFDADEAARELAVLATTVLVMATIERINARPVRVVRVGGPFVAVQSGAFGRAV